MSQFVVDHPNELLDAIGQTLGPSEPLVVTQERINQFAEATGDDQWIHVDPARAAEGPFGRTIAHGYLTLSLAAYFLPQLLSVKNMSMGVNYGTEKVRFPSAVTEGSTLRATGEIISAEESAGGIKVVVRMTLAADGAERPACVVDTISLFYP
jgi:acyl dehydratase